MDRQHHPPYSPNPQRPLNNLFEVGVPIPVRGAAAPYVSPPPAAQPYHSPPAATAAAAFEPSGMGVISGAGSYVPTGPATSQQQQQQQQQQQRTSPEGRAGASPPGVSPRTPGWQPPVAPPPTRRVPSPGWTSPPPAPAMTSSPASSGRGRGGGWPAPTSTPPTTPGATNAGVISNLLSLAPGSTPAGAPLPAPPRGACKCGLGTLCLFENSWTQLRPSAVPGIHSDWVTESIVASARPSDRKLDKHDVLRQCHKLGIKAIINLQEAGEHAHCGDGIVPGGYSYTPTNFTRAHIAYYQFPWADLTAPSLELALSAVQAMETAIAVNKGKVIVHCHAGLGRTGLVIACYLVYSRKLDADAAVALVRKGRPGAVQTPQQVAFVAQFAHYLVALVRSGWRGGPALAAAWRDGLPPVSPPKPMRAPAAGGTRHRVRRALKAFALFVAPTYVAAALLAVVGAGIPWRILTLGLGSKLSVKAAKKITAPRVVPTGSPSLVVTSNAR